MNDLKQETINGILQEGAFDMSDFGCMLQLETGKVGCGSACCIAGHIVAAAVRLDIPLPVDEGNSYDGMIGGPARKLWASQYGQEEANRLCFVEGWEDLYEVTPEQAIAHINGATPAQAEGYED